MISPTIQFATENFGEKTIIISKSGFGKSYTARVVIEDGMKAGHTFVIIDSQDAYLNLKNVEYINPRGIKSVRGFAQLIAKSHKNIVINFKGLSIEDQNKFLNIFLETFKQNIQKGIQTIVIDEIHKFCPEREKTESKNTIRGMFQENRSDGLGIIGISQRVSRIDKTILSQADNIFIGKLTSKVDCESIKGYLDNDEDIEKIKKLDKGEFLFLMNGLDETKIEKVRKSETEHSGSSPKNLLSENTALYSNEIKNHYKNTKMTDTEIGKILPSKKSFMQLAGLGMKVSLGLAVAGVSSQYIASKFNSPIPVISSRTIGSLASTLVLYTGYRYIKNETAKDILKYATAGATAYSVGSLVFDIIGATKIQVPSVVGYVISSATGVQPIVSENTPDADMIA